MSCFGISHSPQFTDVNGIVRENIMEFPDHVRREIKILARKNTITSVQKELNGGWIIRYMEPPLNTVEQECIVEFKN